MARRGPSAGLYEFWRHPEGEWPTSCTIITTSANANMPIHDRIPVILESDVWDRWLDPEPQDRDELEAMLSSGTPGTLLHYPVDTRMGSTKNEDPSLIEPVEVAVAQTLL
ncbi:MAG TPA: SOS response-associated peptidase family protein [Acidimicrobiales bacterium]|nr:SOS response-associated peptidase family protein [Acidimicrobiales bacterium]